MRIEVRRHGFGTYVPEGLNRWMQIGDSVITDPKWIAYHRNNPSLQAVDKEDNLLPIGEYDGKIVYQYYLEDCKSWFSCRNFNVVREILSKGLNVRLVLLAEKRQSPKITNGAKALLEQSLLSKNREDESYTRHN